MKLYRIILTAAAISSALLPSPVSSAQENLIGEITITEEGDSVVTYKPKFFDFGPLNPGKPDMLKHLLENDPLASGKDMDALRKGAFERDLQTMHASAPRMRTMSARKDSRPGGRHPNRGKDILDPYNHRTGSGFHTSDIYRIQQPKRAGTCRLRMEHKRPFSHHNNEQDAILQRHRSSCEL